MLGVGGQIVVLHRQITDRITVCLFLTFTLLFLVRLCAPQLCKGLKDLKILLSPLLSKNMEYIIIQLTGNRGTLQ
jgi:hypothetical protein